MALRRKKRRKIESSHESRVFRVMGAFVIVCLVFAAGFAARSSDVLLSRLGIDTTGADVAQNPGLTVSGDTFDSLAARVAEVQGLLEQRSIDGYDLDDTSRALIEALLLKTEDPYARYYDAQEYAAYRKKELDSQEGIGVLLGDYRNQAYVVDIMPGSAAQREGVQVGDFIVSIDGERRDVGWPVRDALSRINAHEGSSVVITWRHPESLELAGGDERTTTLALGQFDQENVSSYYYEEEQVGYIKIRQFGRDTASSVSKAVEQLVDSGARSFVLDLRNCPGGYLTQAVETASLFLESGVIVQIKGLEEQTSKQASGKTLTTLPMAVVVNKGTAGSAEVLAASLRDNGRATLVGQQTMGKGTIQMMYELSFGGAVSYTVAEYLTASGRAIDKVGISPDLTVEDAEGDSDDLPLSLALEAVSEEAPE